MTRYQKEHTFLEETVWIGSKPFKSLQLCNDLFSLNNHICRVVPFVDRLKHSN